MASLFARVLVFVTSALYAWKQGFIAAQGAKKAVWGCLPLLGLCMVCSVLSTAVGGNNQTANQLGFADASPLPLSSTNLSTATAEPTQAPPNTPEPTTTINPTNTPRPTNTPEPTYTPVAPTNTPVPPTTTPAPPTDTPVPPTPTLAIQARDDMPQPAGTELQPATVVDVADGDTISVDIGRTIERVRFIGIDTPESVAPNSPVECFGVEASNRTKELLRGQTVYLESDPSQDSRDRYNRILRYVWLQDGTLVNLALIRDGYAFEYTYQTPYRYQAEFKAAQQEAEVKNVGLWSPSTCNGEQVAIQPTPRPVQPPPPPAAPPVAQPPAAPAGPCDPSYPTVCIPPPPPDLNCGDISHRRFVVRQPDPHRFDGNKDGVGCESN